MESLTPTKEEEGGKEMGNTQKMREVLKKVMEVDLWGAKPPFDADSSEVYHSATWDGEKFLGKKVSVRLLYWCFTALYEAQQMAREALAVPARPCDTMGWREAWAKWRTEVRPQKPETYGEAYDGTAAFMDWFTGPEGGEEKTK